MDTLHLLLVTYSCIICANSDPSLLDPYSDDIFYEIDWLEDITTDTPNIVDGLPNPNVLIHTNNDESYRCEVPYYADEEMNTNGNEEADSMTPEVLMKNVFQAKECVYLVEGYWSYELCHGTHLRQFHEDRDMDGKIKVTEYILGKQTSEEFPPKAELPPPLWQYDGVDHPYYTVQFDGGTQCDIRQDVGRSAKLIYICDEGHSLIPSLVLVKESKTCEYEAVILSSQLCQNIAYRIKKKPVHNIKCYPVNDSPRVPKAVSLYGFPSSTPVPSTEEIFTNPHRSIRPQAPPPSPPILNEKFIESILTADHCLLGKSTGWWQHELCLGKHVKQVHLENGEIVQEVLLGKWDESAHKEWYTAKAGKSKKSKNHVMHLYGNGELCDLTSLPRRVRVKFRCMNNANSLAKVTVSLEEPTSCNYILTVEAKFICNLLQTVDEHGLFHYQNA